MEDRRTLPFQFHPRQSSIGISGADRVGTVPARPHLIGTMLRPSTRQLMSVRMDGWNTSRTWAFDRAVVWMNNQSWRRAVGREQAPVCPPDASTIADEPDGHPPLQRDPSETNERLGGSFRWPPARHHPAARDGCIRTQRQIQVRLCAFPRPAAGHGDPTSVRVSGNARSLLSRSPLHGLVRRWPETSPAERMDPERNVIVAWMNSGRWALRRRVISTMISYS